MRQTPVAARIRSRCDIHSSTKRKLEITPKVGSIEKRLEREWAEVCDRYLPIRDAGSFWRFSRLNHERDLSHGWKLHVSATILNASAMLQRIAPVLNANGVQFKAPRSLDEVRKVNAGLLGTYSQVGKIFTVYPRDDDEAVELAGILHRLTYRFKCPSVPFDLRLRGRSNIYYRYGAFKRIELEQDGGVVPAVISASGELVPDVRENPKPEWVSDPFAKIARPAKPPRASETTSSFLVMRALVQRGKGGVYQALDIQTQPPRFCLLKEGRRYGELNWDGRDGTWRVRHERRVLSALSRSGIRVPKVYSSFKASGNAYLAIEFIEGESLYSRLMRRQRRLSVSGILELGIQIAAFLETMHHAGWAWRDCKPSNLLVTAEGRLVPIDFEGAERIDRPDPYFWGTPGFMPRAAQDQTAQSGLTDDLFALGAVLFFLTTGRMFDDAQQKPIERLRRHVPLELRQLIVSLLDSNPQTRPTAQRVRYQLQIILRQCGRSKRLAEARAA